MIDINELRQSLGAIQTEEVAELLDRLEAAESDALEQARLNGMGASREAALMAKLEAAEKDIALKERIIDSLGSELNAVANKRDDLLARIETMEKQEPVGEMLEVSPHNYELRWYRSVPFGAKLYLAPGAQPAPSVPEDVMRDAERYRYLRARDDGTAGVGCWLEADGRVCDKGWFYGVQLDSAIDCFIELLAAAPEPKP